MGANFPLAFPRSSAFTGSNICTHQISFRDFHKTRNWLEVGVEERAAGKEAARKAIRPQQQAEEEEEGEEERRGL